jgi:chromosome partitioning protein
MGRVISILNEKGGVGKTTTVIESAFHAGSGLKLKCLVVDLDPQANATTMLTGGQEHKLGAFDLLTDGSFKTSPFTALQPAIEEWVNVCVLPADRRLGSIEVHLQARINRDNILKRILEPLKAYFDLILIDLPPTVNALTVNALAASDGYLVPTDLSQYSRAAIRTIQDLVNLVKSNGINANLEFMGVVVTSFQKGGSIAVRQLIDDLTEEYKERLIPTRIPDSVKVTEAQLKKKPVGLIDPDGAVSIAYRELSRRLMGELK